MAGGHHDAGAAAKPAGREIHLLGAAQAQVGDVGARAGHAFGHGVGDFGAGQARVAPQHHFLRSGETNNSGADAAREVGIELAGDAAAHVVGLERRLKPHQARP